MNTLISVIFQMWDTQIVGHEEKVKPHFKYLK